MKIIFNLLLLLNIGLLGGVAANTDENTQSVIVTYRKGDRILTAKGLEPVSFDYYAQLGGTLSVDGDSIKNKQDLNNVLKLFPDVSNVTFYSGNIDNINLENLGKLPYLRDVTFYWVFTKLNDDQIQRFSSLYNLKSLSIVDRHTYGDMDELRWQLQWVLPNTNIDVQFKTYDPETSDHWLVP